MVFLLGSPSPRSVLDKVWIPLLPLGMLIQLCGGQGTCVNATVCDLIPLSPSVCGHRSWCLMVRLLGTGQCPPAKGVHGCGIATQMESLVPGIPSPLLSAPSHLSSCTKKYHTEPKVWQRHLEKCRFLYLTPVWRNRRNCADKGCFWSFCLLACISYHLSFS